MARYSPEDYAQHQRLTRAAASECKVTREREPYHSPPPHVHAVADYCWHDRDCMYVTNERHCVEYTIAIAAALRHGRVVVMMDHIAADAYVMTLPHTHDCMLVDLHRIDGDPSIIAYSPALRRRQIRACLTSQLHTRAIAWLYSNAIMQTADLTHRVPRNRCIPGAPIGVGVAHSEIVRVRRVATGPRRRNHVWIIDCHRVYTEWESTPFTVQHTRVRSRCPRVRILTCNESVLIETTPTEFYSAMNGDLVVLEYGDTWRVFDCVSGRTSAWASPNNTDWCEAGLLCDGCIVCTGA